MLFNDSNSIFIRSLFNQSLSRNLYPSSAFYGEDSFEEKNEIIFTPIINEYINSNEDIKQDEFNEDSFSKNINNDFYKENISEFEENLCKIDTKKEKPFQIFNPNLENN